MGDRRENLLGAVAELPRHGVRVIASSSVYETQPVGLVLDQRDFYNACLRLETDCGPEELLDACKTVERALGRVAGGVRHGPRPIDVDVLLLDGVELATDRLLERYEVGAVWVKAAKPEPPMALPVVEVSVEVWREAE